MLLKWFTFLFDNRGMFCSDLDNLECITGFQLNSLITDSKQ